MHTNATPPALTIPDVETGLTYLNRLPLANPTGAEQQLSAFLDALLAAPPATESLFTLLEHARVPLAFVEEEMARRYQSKPLVFAQVEETHFQQVVGAWRKMCKAYALCAQRHEPQPDNPRYPVMMATILHRCLYYTGMIILEHFRARRQVPEGIWLSLHGYFATAEEWDFALVPVEDTLDHERHANHCMAAYVSVLLMDAASPYSQTNRDLHLIRRWAGLWSPLVPVLPLSSEEQEQPVFAVELLRDAPLHPLPPKRSDIANIRRLDTSRLGSQINQVLAQLRQKISPSQLGLGEETSSHVIKMLEDLRRPWSQLTANRKFRRFLAEGKARVAIGFEAMHYLIGGEEFTQPDVAHAYSRKDFDALFIFRHQVDPGQKLSIHETPNYPVDDWDVVNHSANGFRLTRSLAGQKLAHGQLVAVCPHDGENFLLGLVTWLMQEQSGNLIAGVAIMPGLPQAIGVRHPSQNAATAEKFVRAFLLPEVPAIQEPGSLILPSSAYQPGRPLEIISGERKWQVKMKTVVYRGADFERINYDSL